MTIQQNATEYFHLVLIIFGYLTYFAKGNLVLSLRLIAVVVVVVVVANVAVVIEVSYAFEFATITNGERKRTFSLRFFNQEINFFPLSWSKWLSII